MSARDWFQRAHERPWVYVASFCAPLVAGFGLAAVLGAWPVALFAAYLLYLEALWRHRLVEIQRDGDAARAAVDRRFDRRARVIARARLDPSYARQLDLAVAARGDAAFDDFPLPPREDAN